MRQCLTKDGESMPKVEMRNGQLLRKKLRMLREVSGTMKKMIDYLTNENYHVIN